MNKYYNVIQLILNDLEQQAKGVAHKTNKDYGEVLSNYVTQTSKTEIEDKAEEVFGRKITRQERVILFNYASDAGMLRR